MAAAEQRNDLGASPVTANKPQFATERDLIDEATITGILAESSELANTPGFPSRDDRIKAHAVGLAAERSFFLSQFTSTGEAQQALVSFASRARKQHAAEDQKRRTRG